MTNSNKKTLHSVGASSEPAAPADEQTTLRVPRDIHEKLKVIAAYEGTTIMSISTNVLGEYIRRYESVTGRPLSTRPKSKAPKS